MKSDSIREMKNHRLDAPSHLVPDENVDIWFARDLMALFGYARWENFQAVIKWAIESCETAGYDPNNHFRGVKTMVKLGSEAERAIDDFMLTRYACYLIAQNDTPRSETLEPDAQGKAQKTICDIACPGSEKEKPPANLPEVHPAQNG